MAIWSNKSFKQIRKLIVLIIVICFVFLWPIGVLAVYLARPIDEHTKDDAKQCGKVGGILVPRKGGGFDVIKFH